MIKKLVLPLLIGLSVCPSVVAAGDIAPTVIEADSLKWFSPPGNAKLQGAWVLDSEKAEGTYVLRVKLAAGGVIPPHTHPDTRYTTVMSGTLYVGFGDSMKDAEWTVVPSGAVYVAPADQPHFLKAGDENVVYQEGGRGPTATRWLGR